MTLVPEADIRSFRGANLLVPRPSSMLEMALPDWPRLQTAKRRAALAEELRTALKSDDRQGHWAELSRQADLGAAAFLAPLLALTAITLQQRIGRRVMQQHSLVLDSGKRLGAVWEHFIAYEGQAAGRAALDLVSGFAAGRGGGAKAAATAEAAVAALREMLPDPVADVIMEGMTARGLPWRIFDYQWPGFEAGYGCRRQRLMTSMPDSQSHVDRMVFRNKFYAGAILREAGLPIPDHAIVGSPAQAVAAAARIGYPVVVKPVDAGRSKGVTINLTSPDSVPEAFAFARRFGSAVLVERFIPGLPYRILILDGQVIAVARRGIPSVTGDGKHSVRALIESENARRERENLTLSQPFPLINIAAFEEECMRRLAEQDLTLDAVPAKDRDVWLAHHAQRGRGGLNVDVTSQMHPDHLDLAAQVAAIMRCPMIGIDFITPDICRSFREVPSGINEVNIEPALNLHMRMTRAPRDVVAPLLDKLFPAGDDGRIPMLAVHGAAAAPLGLLRRALRLAGHRVGFAARDGRAWIGEDAFSFRGAPDQRIASLLFDPRVEALIFELNKEDFNRGFAFDLCDAVLTLPGQARFDKHDVARARLLQGMTRRCQVLPLEHLEAWQRDVGALPQPAVLFSESPGLEIAELAGTMQAGHKIVGIAAGAPGALGIFLEGHFDLLVKLAADADRGAIREALLAAAGLLGLGFAPQEARRYLNDAMMHGSGAEAAE